MKHYNFWSDK